MTEQRDKSSRTLTVGQLIEKLSRLDPSLPVVFEARDEPLGDYGVRSFEVCEMQRERTYASDPFGCDVFHSHVSGGYGDRPKEWWTDRHSGDRYDDPQEVVILRYESEYQPVIDGVAEVVPLALTPSGLDEFHPDTTTWTEESR